MNKYLISVDIEGITGVVSTSFSSSRGKHYEMARKYMVSDVNAVVEGILSADHESWIVVRDAHGGLATNLDLEKLHPRANLVQGWGNELNMLTPVDSTYKGIFLVGFHAGGHNNEAVLAHVYSSLVHHVKANGKEINEAGLAGIYAGHYNVPIAFISGDNHTVKEAEQQFGSIIGVSVKESLGRDSTLSLSLVEASKLLGEGAQAATLKLLAGAFAPFKLSLPISVEIKLYNTGYYISIFRKILGILSFDKAYNFDKETFVIKYTAQTQLEMFQRLGLLTQLMYGANSTAS